MWDETLIETKAVRKKRSWLILPVSLGLHAVTIAAIIAASYWQIETVTAPQNNTPMIYAQIVSTPAPPLKYAPKPSQTKGSTASVAVVAPDQPVTQQQITPEQTDHEPSVQVGDGPGSPDGVIDGSETGSPDGVIGADGSGTDPDAIGFPVSDLPQIVTAEMVKPSLIRRVEPAYPELARKLRLQGIVILRAIINRMGDVENIEVLQSPHPLFVNPSVEAVRQWKYRPATLNGRPLKVYFTVTVKYTLQ